MFQNQSATQGLKPHELAIFVDLLKSFDLAASNVNASYFLWAGTLIGAYRNGTIMVRV